MWPNLFAIFELKTPSDKLILKWTESLLFGEMSHIRCLSEGENKSIVFSTDFSGHHLDIIDENEIWYTPFSIEDHIKSLRAFSPENERSLEHGYSTDWESHFAYSDNPFFMVHEACVNSK